MMRFTFIMLLLITSSVLASPRLIIKNPKQYSFDQAKLEEQFQLAYQFFAKEVGELNGSITISIAPESCFRTGYDRASGEVAFCPVNKVINAGLDSVDVVNHELFHAFICSYDTSLCELKNKDHLHEALADVFAYQLAPDQYFGENYYKGQEFIRKYKTDWRPGLVQGDHEKGNALASIFISKDSSLKKLLSQFEEADQKEEVTDIVTGVPASSLNRYRLQVNQPIQIEFQFAESSQVHSVEWVVPAGIEIEKTDSMQFSVQLTTNQESSKAFAVFLSEDGREMGRRTYYFGLKK